MPQPNATVANILANLQTMITGPANGGNTTQNSQTYQIIYNPITSSPELLDNLEQAVGSAGVTPGTNEVSDFSYPAGAAGGE